MGSVVSAVVTVGRAAIWISEGSFQGRIREANHVATAPFGLAGTDFITERIGAFVLLNHYFVSVSFEKKKKKYI